MIILQTKIKKLGLCTYYIYVFSGNDFGTGDIFIDKQMFFSKLFSNPSESEPTKFRVDLHGARQYSFHFVFSKRQRIPFATNDVI